jgi:hypothetical protein
MIIRSSAFREGRYQPVSGPSGVHQADIVRTSIPHLSPDAAHWIQIHMIIKSSASFYIRNGIANIDHTIAVDIKTCWLRRDAQDKIDDLDSIRTRHG